MTFRQRTESTRWRRMRQSPNGFYGGSTLGLERAHVRASVSAGRMYQVAAGNTTSDTSVDVIRKSIDYQVELEAAHENETKTRCA